MLPIAVDAMGGDQAPEAVVEGAVRAARTGVPIILVGERARDGVRLAFKGEGGVVIDGAGIGSTMAANKVCGVLAANCWDERTARNAREHNYANVLTLGGRMQSEETLHAIVRAFIATPEGAERHGRRVEKITRIERRYASKREEKK